MALPLLGFDLICPAAPSECLFGELYPTSLTCGMVFLKARLLAHFSLQFMQAHCWMSWRSTFQLDVHCYADDSQLYISFSPKAHSGQADAVASIEHCIQDIRQWMSQDKLLMNDAKTELLLIGTRQQLTKITIDGITVGHSVIAPQSPVRNLEVWLDSNLSMGDHITKTSSAAFYYLYNIRRIRKYLSKECTKILIHAFISSHLDHCNSLLYGLPTYQIQ